MHHIGEALSSYLRLRSPFDAVAVGVVVFILTWVVLRERTRAIEENPTSRLIHRVYEPVLRWILRHKMLFLLLPVLIVIVNNSEWGAVRQSVLGIYPDGHAARSNVMPLTSLAPTPDFVQVAKASRAWAQHVDHGEDLPGILLAAIDHVKTKRTHALVEVRVRP